MTELPSDPIDELLHRAHNEAQGAPASFKGRLRARMAAEATVRRQTRAMFFKVGIAIAAVLVLSVAVGMNIDLFLPEKPTIEPQPQAKTNDPAPQPAPDQPAPTDNTDNGEQPVPEPTPEPELEPADPIPDDLPEDQVEEKLPPNTQDQPEREPEPKPEPIKPDDVIEEPESKPEPKEPEGTEVKPVVPDKRAVLATQIGEAKFKLKYGMEEWRDFKDEPLLDGVFLRAGRDPVDLNLQGGAQARFNGEVRLSVEGTALQFSISDDSLYVDNLNTGRQVSVLAAEQSSEMDDGAGVFYLNRGGLEAACLAGKLAINGTPVEAGTSRRATKRGVADAKTWRGDPFLKSLPERVLLREDFDEPPAGGMYDDGERLENGIAIIDGAPRYLAFNFEPQATVLPGMLLRFRFRVTDISKLELELFQPHNMKLLKKNGDRMFKHSWNPDHAGEWQTIELLVEEIPERDTDQSFPAHGDELRNFKLHYQGGDKAKLEIDWVEFVRVQN